MEMPRVEPNPDTQFIPPISAPTTGEQLDDRVGSVNRRMKELKTAGFSYVAVESIITYKLDVDSIKIDSDTKELIKHSLQTIPYQTKAEIIKKYLGKEGNVGSAELKGTVEAVELVESSIDPDRLLVFVKYKE